VAASSRRRRRSSRLVLLFGLLATGVIWTICSPGGSAQTTADQNEAVKQGRALYLQGCSSCHGLQGQGGSQAPSLVGVGGAAVDFQVSTGRMPLAAPGAQADPKDPLYSRAQIDQLTAYIETLGGGPRVPVVTADDIKNADLAFGGELFRANCAQCHQAAGQGGALTYGKHAPALNQANAKQIIEAMRTGPESMPVFGAGQINDEQAHALAAYVLNITNTKDPGGNGLGHYGPVPEGLVAFVIGIGGLLLVCLWIGARQTR
jgi:ubiquinol-cytochrome c reductase cytochrome c subunit